VGAIQKAMSTLEESSRRRGTELLLTHCAAALSRMPATERLSAELGADFSRRLVAALANSSHARRRAFPGDAAR
jgi:hypothetical protein